MVRIFVGSSSEARSNGALATVCNAIVAALGDVEVRPWTDIFTQGEFTLQSLVEEVRHADFAVLIFAKDDELYSRGARSSITRGNVLLESGMFLGKLGPRRVAHVVEGDVGIPTDLNGLTTIPVHGFGEPDLQDAAARITADIKRTWGSYRDLSDYGLDRTLRGISDHADGLRDRLLLGPARDRTGEPVIIDSLPCQDAYEEGLSNVEHRFWTTTYLTSGFWTTNAVEALEANQNLLSRISSQPGYSVKRIFLLPKPRHVFIQSERLRITNLRDREEDDEVLRQIDEIRVHESNIQHLNNDGCQTRCAHDLLGANSRRLNAVVQKRYREGDTELAIYDEFRLDLFSGGATGSVDRVICFLKGTKRFDPVMLAGLRYFEDLWQSGDDALLLVKDWRQAVERAAESLSYPPDWQWIYDHDLPPHDEALKAAEMEATTIALRRRNLEHIRRYLDIGTCTGRYPINLQREGFLNKAQKVVALDADRHCCRTTRKNLIDAGVSNIDTPCEDFLVWGRDEQESFDLITCMLGTLSHFGAPVSDEPNGKIFESLKIMADLLEPEGLLVLGTWSRNAISSSNFLSIYNLRSQQKLAQWSPTKEQVGQALTQAGLNYTVTEVENRLQVWVCHKALAPSLAAI